MTTNHKLARAIADIGFYEFRRQFDYKMALRAETSSGGSSSVSLRLVTAESLYRRSFR